MTKREDTIIVFTADSRKRLIDEHGSQAWVASKERAEQCTWLVCTRNQLNRARGRLGGPEPHGSGFLVGEIHGILPPTESGSEGRWMIAISKYADIAIPDLWFGGQPPLRYTTLDALGIDTGSLNFQALQ